MKLLFDENLAARLVPALAGHYPASVHVVAVGLGAASDQAIWNYARTQDFVIVSKDQDFLRLSVLLGQPPKVIWISLGNCSTNDVIYLLERQRGSVESFAADSEAGFLVLM